MTEWISVEEKLPKIPEGKHGISVLAVEFDPVYAEINKKYKGDVREILFTKKYGWTDMLMGMKHNDVDFTYCCHPITHWMPLPEPPAGN